MMKDVRRGMTNTELVTELKRLRKQPERSQCDQMRMELVLDELACRESDPCPDSRRSGGD